MKHFYNLLFAIPFLLSSTWTEAQSLQLSFQTAPADNCLPLGSATAVPTGGTGNYAFTWSTGDTTAMIDSLSSGVYTVTVTDGIATVTDNVYISFWQGPVFLSDTVLTGPDGAKAVSIEPLQDGGYLICGSFYHQQMFPPYSWLPKEMIARISPDGSLQWVQYNNSQYSWITGESGCELANGDIVQLVGTGGEGTDYVRHYTKNGVSKSTILMPNVHFEELSDVVPTEDGYLIMAYVYGPYFGASFGGSDVLLMRYTTGDSLLWSKHFGGTKDDWGYKLEKLSDGNYLVAGSSKSGNGDVGENAGGADAWFFKVNPAGELLWSKVFGGSADEGRTTVTPTLGGGALATVYNPSHDGDFVSNYNGPAQWYFRLDGQANVMWAKSDTSFFAADISQAKDGGFLICGGLYDSPKNFFKIDDNGMKEWQHTLPGDFLPVGIGELADEGVLLLRFNSSAYEVHIEKYEGPSRPNFNWSTQALNCAGDSLLLDITDTTCNSCTYLWDDGYSEPMRIANTASPSNFAATITDANGCTMAGSFNLPAPMPFEVSLIASGDLFCQYFTVDWLEAYLSGGNGPYAMQWNNGSESPILQNLYTGTYSVTATDATGCTALDTIVFDQPPILTFDTIFVMPHPGASDGTIELIPVGDHPPFSIIWANGQTGSLLSNIPAGFYEVTVTDAVGCVLNEVIPLETVSQVGVNAMGNWQVTVYPNPVGESVHVSFRLPEATEVEVEVLDALGRCVASLLPIGNHPAGEISLKMNTAGWQPGLYFIHFQADGKSLLKKMVKW